MKLPEKKSVGSPIWNETKIGMIGLSGVGKTSFFAQDDKALFIEAEKGLSGETVFKVPARSWSDVEEIYKELASRKDDFPYAIVVLDTIDRIVGYAEDRVVGNAKNFFKNQADKINSIGDIPNGAGYFKTTKLVMSFLGALENLPCAVAYIGHLANKTIKPDMGQDYTRQTISIWGKLGENLLAWTDHTLHVKATLRGETLARTVYTLPTQSREAKSRGAVVPNGWKWEANSKVNYEYLESCLNNREVR